MQKTPLPPAIYHGTNSFAKENYRETTYPGFGCNGPVPDNRGVFQVLADGNPTPRPVCTLTGLHDAS